TEAVRPTVVVHVQAPTRSKPVQTSPVARKRVSPHPGKRPSPKTVQPKPAPPPVTPPTTPPPTSPPGSPPAPTPTTTNTTNTTPVAAPPVVVETKTRPGNGRGDRNHVHTGPPGHSK